MSYTGLPSHLQLRSGGPVTLRNPVIHPTQLSLSTIGNAMIAESVYLASPEVHLPVYRWTNACSTRRALIPYLSAWKELFSTMLRDIAIYCSEISCSFSPSLPSAHTAWATQQTHGTIWVRLSHLLSRVPPFRLCSLCRSSLLRGWCGIQNVECCHDCGFTSILKKKGHVSLWCSFLVTLTLCIVFQFSHFVADALAEFGQHNAILFNLP